MRIGVPKETAAGEHRVALVPEVVGRLKAKGLDVTVQSGAGADALLPDGAFSEAGARVTHEASEVWESDVVVVIAPPEPELIRGAAGGRRAGALTGRAVAGLGRGGGGRGRLRARAHRPGARPPAAGANRRDQGLRRGDHDRARAGPARARARHRRGRGGHEAGIGDRRPRGRDGRQLRADRARADGRAPRRKDHRAAEPARDDGRARLAAVRAQRARAARAVHGRGRQPAPGLRRRGRRWRVHRARRRDRARRRALHRRGGGMIVASVLTKNLAILVLAGFIGFVVISRVPNTLHTPLMFGTNAIHGIVLLAALLIVGLAGNGAFNKVILVIAITFGTINVVGGFLVTDRMLEMFKSKPKA